MAAARARAARRSIRASASWPPSARSACAKPGRRAAPGAGPPRAGAGCRGPPAPPCASASESSGPSNGGVAIRARAMRSPRRSSVSLSLSSASARTRTAFVTRALAAASAWSRQYNDGSRRRLNRRGVRGFSTTAPSTLGRSDQGGALRNHLEQAQRHRAAQQRDQQRLVQLRPAQELAHAARVLAGGDDVGVERVHARRRAHAPASPPQAASTPRPRPTLLNAATARSRCSGVCAAEICTRMRA